MNATRSRSIPLLLTAIVAAALVAGDIRPVRAHAPDPVLGGGLFGQDQALTFRWRSGSEPPAILKTAIRNAATDSNATRGSRAATFAYDAGGTSSIGYGTGTCGVNGIGCFTRTAPTSFTMWLREHGRVYDWGTLRWCQMQSNPTNGCYDAETIALDEFGHVEILGHHANHTNESDYTDAVVQAVSRTRPKVGYDMHAYGVCDVATLQVQYDVPAASSPYSTCLDLATVLGLTTNYTSIGYRGTVTATATLRIATSSAYGRLSANPISKRTVVLQTRVVGSTTWTTVATMASGSPTGSYTAAVTLTATSDLRAVFSAPSSEGLRSATSPSVRVNVAPCTYSCPQPVTAQ